MHLCVRASLSVCVCVPVYVCVFVCVFVCACVYVCIYVYVYIACPTPIIPQSDGNFFFLDGCACLYEITVHMGLQTYERWGAGVETHFQEI